MDCICLVCGIYHYTYEQVEALTIKQFISLQKNITTLIKLTNPFAGGEEDKKKNGIQGDVPGSAEAFKRMLNTKKSNKDKK